MKYRLAQQLLLSSGSSVFYIFLGQRKLSWPLTCSLFACTSCGMLRFHWHKSDLNVYGDPTFVCDCKAGVYSHTTNIGTAFFYLGPCSGLLRTQKLKAHLLRTPSSKILPLKSGVGQNVAGHASPTVRDFFFELISTFLAYSPSFFSKLLSLFSCISCCKRRFLCRSAEWNRSSCSSQTIDAGSRVECPRNIGRK